MSTKCLSRKSIPISPKNPKIKTLRLSKYSLYGVIYVAFVTMFPVSTWAPPHAAVQWQNQVSPLKVKSRKTQKTLFLTVGANRYHFKFDNWRVEGLRWVNYSAVEMFWKKWLFGDLAPKMCKNTGKSTKNTQLQWQKQVSPKFKVRKVHKTVLQKAAKTSDA